MFFLIFALIIILFCLNFPRIWSRQILQKLSVERQDLYGNGSDFAHYLLDHYQIDQVKVEKSSSNHYDPINRAVRLDPVLFDRPSIASLTMAAHEVSHAIQHQTDPQPLLRRHHLAILGIHLQRIGVVLFALGPIIGFLFHFPAMILPAMGVGLFLLALPILFHVLTLPVEWDASFQKASKILTQGQYLAGDDLKKAHLLLHIAAFAYVTASLSNLLNIGHWMRLFRMG